MAIAYRLRPEPIFAKTFGPFPSPTEMPARPPHRRISVTTLSLSPIHSLTQAPALPGGVSIEAPQRVVSGVR